LHRSTWYLPDRELGSDRDAHMMSALTLNGLRSNIVLLLSVCLPN